MHVSNLRLSYKDLSTSSTTAKLEDIPEIPGPAGILDSIPHGPK